MKLFLLFPLALLAGCASNPNKVQNLSTEIEQIQPLSRGEDIGVKKNELIIQKKTLVAEELRALQYSVHGLEDQTYGGLRYYGNPGIWGALNDCRIKMASAENGGSGKLTYIEPQEYVVPEEEMKQIGFDEKGHLISLNEEYLKERIERYQGYKKVLQERNRALSDKFEMCKLDLQAQKIKSNPVPTTQVADQK